MVLVNWRYDAVVCVPCITELVTFYHSSVVNSAYTLTSLSDMPRSSCVHMFITVSCMMDALSPVSHQQSHSITLQHSTAHLSSPVSPLSTTITSSATRSWPRMNTACSKLTVTFNHSTVLNSAYSMSPPDSSVSVARGIAAFLCDVCYDGDRDYYYWIVGCVRR